MNKAITYIYTFFTYCVTAIVMIYFVGFYENWLVPLKISGGKNESITLQVVISNFGLILLFGIQHSIMARDWFKKRWQEIIPEQVERVTYVLISSILLGIIIGLWQPINIVIWDFRGSAIGVFIQSLSFLGLFVVAISVFSLSAADFSGWRQANADEKSTI